MEGILSPGWAAQIFIEQPYQRTWLETFRPPFLHWLEPQAGDIYLRSKSFDLITSAKELRPVAVDVLRILAGAITLSTPLHEARFLSAVSVDSTGKRSITAFLEGISILTFTGKLDSGGPPSALAAITTANKNAHIEDAMAYYGAAGGWFDLYKCIESLEAWAGGEHKLANVLPAMKTNLKAAKSTANSTRHYWSTSPVKKSYAEARVIVREAILAALEMQNHTEE